MFLKTKNKYMSPFHKNKGKVISPLPLSKNLLFQNRTLLISRILLASQNFICI